MIKSITWGANVGQTFVMCVCVYAFVCLHYAHRYATPTGTHSFIGYPVQRKSENRGGKKSHRKNAIEIKK